MGRARARNVARELKYLTRSEWERIIYESALGEEDTIIAKMYLLDAIPQVEIGVCLNLDRTTVSRRLPRILSKIESTFRKIYKIKS